MKPVKIECDECGELKLLYEIEITEKPDNRVYVIRLPRYKRVCLECWQAAT